MSVKLSNKDYIWSYIGVFMSVGASAIMLPFILYFLNEDMYGLWSVFQSAMAITTLFDFGFSASFSRNINYCWCGATELKKTGVVYAESREPNFQLMKRTMTACRYVFLLLSGAAFLFMTGPGTVYILYITKSLSRAETLSAWAFYVAAVFLNLYYGYYNTFLRGVGAITDANRAMVVAKLILILLTVTLLMLGFGIVGTGVAYFTYGFSYRILSRRAFLRYKGIGKNLDSVTEKASRQEIKDLFTIVWHNAKKEGGVTLSEYLANQACTIISPLFLSLHMTGVYSLAVQFATVLANVAATLYSANVPVLQSAYITNDKDRTRRTMALTVFSYVALFAIGLLVVIGAGLPILRLIKPDTTPSAAVVLGVGLYQFMLKYRNCFTSYFSCTNRIPYAKAFIISSVVCAMLALAMLRLGWGIWGLILAQIVGQGIYNVWYWPIRAHREMGMTVKDMLQVGSQETYKLLQGFFKKKKD